MPGGIDPTGYVKGWAAKRALNELVPTDVCGAIVNAAGDVVCFGGRSQGVPFRVGIANPRSRLTLACVVELESSIATSGIYERGDHLIAPDTRLPVSRYPSASVCGKDLGLADALATALAVGGGEVLELISRIEGYEALAVEFDGKMRHTSGFPLVST
jgi:thiamine biosynthesis lipoprotein